MSLIGTLLGSARRRILGGPPVDPVCPICGSLLDAPRLNPTTRRMARKCAACVEWHPVEDTQPPVRAE